MKYKEENAGKSFPPCLQIFNRRTGADGAYLMDLQQFTKTLDAKKNTTPRGVEYWRARDIQSLLGYDTWQNFEAAIERAKSACESIGSNPQNQFSDATKLVAIGSGAQRPQRDVCLTRLACYLIAMNGDPRKPEVAMAQTYFAVQTRRQELFDQSVDDIKRMELRRQIKDHNRYLSGAAKKSGVKRFDWFQDEGYRGLYGGLGVLQIKKKKSIPENEDLLDRAGRAELAMNDFRITQTEQRLATVRGDWSAMDTHRQVGAEVREAVKRINGVMPEQLPPEDHIKLVQRRIKEATKRLPPANES